MDVKYIVRRVIAFFIDLCVEIFIYLIIMSPRCIYYLISYGYHSLKSIIMFLLFDNLFLTIPVLLAVNIIYSVAFTKTLGKNITGIQIKFKDISISDSSCVNIKFLRECVKLACVPIYLPMMIIMLFKESNITVWDLVCKTEVYDTHAELKEV